jgi:hypothetical protein
LLVSNALDIELCAVLVEELGALRHYHPLASIKSAG